jgi:hypothetical protein
MSNLLDLSGKIDPLSLALFGTLSEAANTLGVPFFVVGAIARDLIFEKRVPDTLFPPGPFPPMYTSAITFWSRPEEERE